MFEDLECLGFVQNKTHVLAMPNIPQAFLAILCEAILMAMVMYGVGRFINSIDYTLVVS
jgi:hypothetical protein